MARKNDGLLDGVWPRLLTEIQAAAYLNVGVNTFRRLEDAPSPVRLGGMRESRYDRQDLDAYIEACKQGRKRRSWRIAETG